MGRKAQPRTDVRALLRGTFLDIEAIARSKTARTALLKTLQEADAALGAKLLAHNAKAGGAAARFSGASATAYQAQAQLSIRYVQKRLAGLTEAQATRSIAQSLGRTVTLMEGLEKRFRGASKPIPLHAAAELRATGARSKGVWLRDFQSSVDRYGARMIGQFENVIRQGLVTGKTNEEMVSALVGHGGPDGLFVKNKYWAERIVRTETLRAYNGARQAGFETMSKDDPSLHKKIIAIFDKRTAQDSVAVHGQVRAVKDLFMDGAGRQYLYPPARPNDRETTIPWHVEWEKDDEELDDFEKAVLGELSKEEEDELIRRIQGNAKKTKPKPPPKKLPKSIAKVDVNPMKLPTPPPVVTATDRMTQSYLDDLQVRTDMFGNTSMSFGGKVRGHVRPINGKFYATTRTLDDIDGNLTIHDTKEGAVTALRNALTVDARAAAKLSADKYDLKEMTEAMLANDGATTRAHVRAALRDAGVLPRDPARNPVGAASFVTKGVPKGAEAAHGWDGTLMLHPQALQNYGTSMSRGGINAAGNLNTLIHEELHGATPYSSTRFYRGAGATIEEVTVEAASRKVTAPLMGRAPNYTFGPYQPEIFQVATIISQEAGITVGAAMETVASTGIRMRAPAALEAIGRPLDTEADILDLFAAHLDTSDAVKKAVRSRIEKELGAPYRP